MSQPLTPKQKATLDFIVEYHKKHGVFPAYREMHKHPGAAMRLVDELVARGYLKRIGSHRARNMVLLFNPDKTPNWQAIADELIKENNLLRGRLAMLGQPLPPKSVEY